MQTDENHVFDEEEIEWEEEEADLVVQSNQSAEDGSAGKCNLFLSNQKPSLPQLLH